MLLTNTSPRTRRSIVVTSALAAAALCTLSAAPAMASGTAPQTVSAAAAQSSSVAGATAALAATPWETTGAVDQDGNAVALDDARAANFVGNAYFKTDGTFTMFNLDDSPKMQGAWEMREVDGQLVRWIAAKNAAGEVLFERVMPIVELDGSVFTYRVVSAADPAEWVDIVHTPTDHVEPGTDTENENEGDNGGNGGTGESDGGGAGNGGSVVEEGTSADAGSETSAEANAQSGEAPNAEPAVQGKGSGSQELAATGGSGVMAGIAASGVALLGGAALLMTRALRRARG